MDELVVFTICIVSILFASLLVDYARGKWYKKGYLDCAKRFIEVDEFEHIDFERYAKDDFYDRYGFHYD